MAYFEPVNCRRFFGRMSMYLE